MSVHSSSCEAVHSPVFFITPGLLQFNTLLPSLKYTCFITHLQSEQLLPVILQLPVTLQMPSELLRLSFAAQIHFQIVILLYTRHLMVWYPLLIYAFLLRSSSVPPEEDLRSAAFSPNKGLGISVDLIQGFTRFYCL